MRRTMAIVFAGIVFASATTTTASAGSRPARSPFLIALDPKTGEQKWRATNPEHGRWDVLGEQQGVVLLSYGSCDFESRQAIIAVDRDTGEERWRLRGDPPDMTVGAYASTGSAPVVVATVRRTPDDPFGIKRLQGVDARTGRTLWETAPEPYSVVVGGARNVVLMSRVSASPEGVTPVTTELVAIDRDTGEVQWRYQPEISVFPSSLPITNVIDARNVAIANYEGADGANHPASLQVALDTSSGRVLWSTSDHNQALQSERGALLFGGFNRPLTAYDARTRALLWTAVRTVSDVTRSMPEVVIGTDYASAPQRFVALDSHTGEVLWERDRANVQSTFTGIGHGLLVEIGQDPVTYLDSQAVALDSKTGERRWTAELPHHPSRNWRIGKYVYGAYGGCGS